MAVVIDGTTGISTPGLSNSGTLSQTGAATMSNTLQTATTIGVGAATPATSGAGITFPATQSASTDANTLDDYEEGTWTPAYGSQGTQPTVTYNTQGGRYIKVGRIVYFQIYLSTNSFTGGTGAVTITGWPFAFDVGPVSQRISVATETGTSWAGTNVPRGLNIYSSSGAVLVYRNSTAWGEVQVGDATNSSGGYNVFEISGCYLASA